MLKFLKQNTKNYILTKDGYKETFEIRTEDKVLTHTGNFQEVNTTVLGHVDTICNIETKYGDKASIPGEQLVYASKKSGKMLEPPIWIKARELTKDYYIGLVVNTNSKLPDWNGVKYTFKDEEKEFNKLSSKFNTEDFWWVIGQFIRNGRLTEDSIIEIKCDLRENFEMRSKLKVLELNYSVIEKFGIFNFYIPYVEMVEYVKHIRNIPEDILDLPVDLLRAFIDGVFFSVLHTFKTKSPKIAYGLCQCVSKAYNCEYEVEYNRKEIEIKLHKKKTNVYFSEEVVWIPIKEINERNNSELIHDFGINLDNSYIINNIIVHDWKKI